MTPPQIIGLIVLVLIVAFGLITIGTSSARNVFPDKFKSLVPDTFEMNAYNRLSVASVIEVIKTRKKQLKLSRYSTNEPRIVTWTVCCVCKQKTLEDLKFYQKVRYIITLGNLPKEFNYTSLVNFPTTTLGIFGTCSSACTKLLYFALTP